MVPLYQRYSLYSDNDTYIFVPEAADARNLTIHRSSGDIVLSPLKRRTQADDRFFWNRFLQTRLIESATSSNETSSWGPYILPILYGTFDLRPIFLHGRQMQLCLISRRSRYRAGTRYFRRGVDNDGNVANFNETEQILLIEGPSGLSNGFNPESNYSSKFSFVQIRGSIPLFWSELNTLRYKPDLQIMELDNTVGLDPLCISVTLLILAMQQEALIGHLKKQTSTYGAVTLVNLINQKGHEKPVKDAYERHMAQLELPDVKYEYFDFHNECRKMRWDRISLLVDKIQDDLDNNGYFTQHSSDSAPSRLQKGIVRTNCMDNLDRTNVVQATIAKWTLNKQLIEAGVLSPGAGVDDFETLSKEFREMWAEHADAISAAYAGSGALKSDFTRTNKRTHKGLLEDGVKSVTRYLKNTFLDGTKQDAFDLITGAWIPRKNPAASMFLVADARPVIIRSVPAAASFSLFMICAGLTLPRTSDYSLMYYFLLWFIILAAALTFMIIHGVQYVAWPRLNPLTNIIYYDGPGYRSARNGMGLKATAHLDVHKQKWLGAGKHRRGHSVTEEVELGTLKKD
ncbi:hypothetical protein H1R20_g9915, partial [Candolleomyces eurysporus]